MQRKSLVDEQCPSSFVTERRTSLPAIVESKPSMQAQVHHETERGCPSVHQDDLQASKISRKSELLNSHLTSLPSIHHRIQETAEDSSISKLSAVTLGYYEDPYLKFFVRQPCRKSPLINRGYFSRVAAIRMTIASFFLSLKNYKDTIQIVNLGAGFDTIYFWLCDFWRSFKFHMYEIDFSEVLSRKASILLRRQPLRERLALETLKITLESELNQNNRPWNLTSSYTLIPADLKEVEVLNSILTKSGFNFTAPTLFISECVLIYMDPSDSDRVLHWISHLTSGPSAFVLYEQINPHDTFGRTMIRNMEIRGFPLLGIHTYGSIPDQKYRFVSLDWSIVTALDMSQIYDKFLDKYELVRVQGLELLDEMEEWKLIQAHYLFLIAVKPTQSIDFSYLRQFWDDSNHEKQELPRFTTEEFRRNSKAIQSMYSGNLTAESPVKPGYISSLFCPQYISHHQKKVHGGLMIPSGSWALNVVHSHPSIFSPVEDF